MPPGDDSTSAGQRDEQSGESVAGAAEPEDEQSSDPTEEEAAGPVDDGRGRREVELPRSLYKVVTVFSTLLAVVLVVAGFSVLDMATTVLSNPPGALVVRVLAVVVPMEVLVANRSALALAVGLAGLALVAAGGGTYVYGSRFRAPGMGKPKDEADEPSGDG